MYKENTEDEFLLKIKLQSYSLQDYECNDYENGELKSVDIFSKKISLQCSWIKRLYDGNFHLWKVIPY